MQGTYTTIDTPIKPVEESFNSLMEQSFNFLCKEFNIIEGTVRIKNNPHDFGTYKSFEIDYPKTIENAKESIENRELYQDDEDEDIPDYILDEWKTDYECDALQVKIDNWHDKADEIQEKYNHKFFN